MRLYLVRHSEAAPGEPDELRPLTASGRRVAHELGRRLSADGVRPDSVLTSPLLRARQTGSELGRPFGIEPTPDDRLAPGASTADVLAAVSGRGADVVVVGHQPDCGVVAAALQGGPEPRLPPGGMVVIELSD